MTSPVDKRDTEDTGDSTLRKFKYQHGYAAILAVRMVTEPEWNCNAIWCEQLEDILVEFGDGLFDAYQIKTKKSETGAWKLNDEAIIKTIKRFGELDKTHPKKIRKFHFVTNTEFSKSTSKTTEHLSPEKLIKAINQVSSYDALEGKPLEGFDYLKKAVGLESSELFNVLKRLDLIVGPTERAFEDEISQRHITCIPKLKSSSTKAVSKVRDSLIQIISEASSLTTYKASRDWVGLNTNMDEDPYLISKRIAPENVMLCVNNVINELTVFPETLMSMDLREIGKKRDILEKKMIFGGLGTWYEVMRRRSITAEQYLLEQSTRSDNEIMELSQVENIVLGECDEASLRASIKDKKFGPSMLIDVQDRLKNISENSPQKVNNTPYEVLVGVSALLTSECKVWWSEKFDLDELE